MTSEKFERHGADHEEGSEDEIGALRGIVPVGGIILWSGAVADIGRNWALCDGSNGTPDLTDRFVVGAGDSYAVGATGGSSSTGPTQDVLASGSIVQPYSSGTGFSSLTAGHVHSNLPPYYALAYIMRIR